MDRDTAYYLVFPVTGQCVINGSRLMVIVLNPQICSRPHIETNKSERRKCSAPTQ